jgi:hypothetical protein
MPRNGSRGRKDQSRAGSNQIMNDKRRLPHVVFAKTGLMRNRNALLVTCGLVVTAIIVLGLWPFNFFPSNGTNWLGKDKGLRFCHYGVAYSKDSLFLSPLSSTTEAFHPISIEILLKPYEETVGYIAHIVVLSRGLHEAPLLTIGQWKSFLEVLTSRQVDRGDSEVDKLGLRGALRPNEQRFVTLTGGKGGTIIYLDGARAADFPSQSLLGTRGEKASFRVILGNDITGKSPWHGEVLGLAIYERELRPEEVHLHYAQWQQENYLAIATEPAVVGEYTFEEGSGPWVYNRVADSGHLWIPGGFRPLQSEVLATPGRAFKVKWYFIQDVIINILGFVPLGYFLMGLLLASLNRSSSRGMWAGLVVVSVGTGLSLFIEILQVYLPTRDSSLVDVISNTTGTALGGLWFGLISDK